MTPNFQTNKLILAAYPFWAGGKFLINCLGLGKNCVLQDRRLARLQLQGILTPQGKYDLITRRLNRMTPKKSWLDLDLGCEAFFNTENIHPDADYYPIVQSVFDAGLYAFKATHTPYIMTLTKQWWPNAHVIKFINHQTFIKTYRKKTQLVNAAQDYWEKIKGSNWPHDAPANQAQFDQLPAAIKKEIEVIYQNEFLVYHLGDFDETISDETWDCGWYLSEHATVEGVKKLYQKFEIQGFNPTWIATYWRLWTQVLLQLDNN